MKTDPTSSGFPLRRRSKVFTPFEEDYTPLGSRIVNNLDKAFAKIIDRQWKSASKAGATKNEFKQLLWETAEFRGTLHFETKWKS